MAFIIKIIPTPRRSLSAPSAREASPRVPEETGGSGPEDFPAGFFPENFQQDFLKKIEKILLKKFLENSK